MEKSSKASILLVDDEEDILELLKYNLFRECYQVLAVTTGEEAVKAVHQSPPDLIILDLMLPGMDGLEVCKNLKNAAETNPIPIIMLTAKGEDSDIIIGLELGADDYIIKPFSPKILLARVKAVLRRKKESSQEHLSIIKQGELVIYPDRREVFIGELKIELTATEFAVLQLLAAKPGRVFSRSQIVHIARGEDYPVTDRSVDVHIVSLRKKLDKYGAFIQTVRGVGYKFKD